MKRFLSRAAVAGLSAAIVAGAAFVAAPAASAAPIGVATLTNFANTGVQFTGTSNTACPATTTAVASRVTGPTTPAGAVLNTNGNNTAIVTAAKAGPFSLNSQFTLQAAANTAGATLNNGTYTYEILCVAGFTIAGEFVGSFSLSGSTVTPIAADLPDVTTTVDVISAAPVPGTTTATSSFTASVSPTNAVGTVQFTKDGANLGSPVAVAGGTATLSNVPAFAQGTYAIGANFVGGSSSSFDYLNSTDSTPLSYTVDQVTEATAVTLGSVVSPVTFPTAVSLSAAVTDSNGAPVTVGQVQFRVNGNTQGAPQTLDAAGAAGITFTPTAGTKLITVDYLGANVGGVQYLTSNDGPATLVVNPGAVIEDTDVQYVEVSVPEGFITITTPYTSNAPLVLPQMELQGVAGYSSSAPFQEIQVVDTRAGNQAWTAQALSSNFSNFTTGGSSPSETIAAENVGLTGFQTTGTSSLNTIPYGTNIPGGDFNGPFPPATGTNGNVAGFAEISLFNNPAGQYLQPNLGGDQGLGGSVPHKVMHANNGLGTTTVGGTLTITAPTSTVAGLYKGTVTFTVLGS